MRTRSIRDDEEVSEIIVPEGITEVEFVELARHFDFYRPYRPSLGILAANLEAAVHFGYITEPFTHPTPFRQPQPPHTR